MDRQSSKFSSSSSSSDLQFRPQTTKRTRFHQSITEYEAKDSNSKRICHEPLPTTKRLVSTIKSLSTGDSDSDLESAVNSLTSDFTDLVLSKVSSKLEDMVDSAIDKAFSSRYSPLYHQDDNPNGEHVSSEDGYLPSDLSSKSSTGSSPSPEWAEEPSFVGKDNLPYEDSLCERTNDVVDVSSLDHIPKAGKF